MLLHLGDHDPSGKDMSRDIVDRLRVFETYDVEFHRLALNMDQIEEYTPPPNPTKLTDSRASGYIDKYGHECWELDALEPTVIRDLIDENVCKYRNKRLFNSVIKREKEEKELLYDVSRHWDYVAARWEEIKETYC